ncbi:MAG: CDP-diacylglycerol--serine O-phosphatidyltransferase [Gammaproteobacteria bacterium]|nr:CDP-diacylglycerol--serine O-phosphatidyltransferase [Gammaproteobacteria bacterium]
MHQFKDKKPTALNQRGRGIYILPNLFTTAALFAGFYAIVAAISDRYQAAAMAIFVAMIMDGLDGRVARMTNTESDFGKEYDSLSDMVSFGLAPALVVYQWGFQGMSEYGWLWAKLGWLGAFFYTVAAALRLARFNTRVTVVDKRFFQGLPSPSAAGLVAGTVWLGVDIGLEGRDMIIPAFAITVAAGALMVSNFAYYSFKDFNLGQKVQFKYALLIPIILMLIAASPPQMLFLLFFVFSASGPAYTFWRWRKRRKLQAVQAGAAKAKKTDDK